MYLFAVCLYVFCTSYEVCAYENNNAGRYKKTKTSNFCEKCNVFFCKKLFQGILCPLPTKEEIDYMLHLEQKQPFLLYVVFSEFFC